MDVVYLRLYEENEDHEDEDDDKDDDDDDEEVDMPSQDAPSMEWLQDEVLCIVFSYLDAKTLMVSVPQVAVASRVPRR